VNEPERQIVSLLGEAVELSSPEERAAFLDQACAGDPGKRARVEALLRAYEAAGNFLGGNRPSPGPVEVDEELPINERPGTVIGPYKLMEQIGEGGMGLVFVAEQQHPVRRKVALKVIKPGMDTRQVIARFEAERQALALMDHPNIAKVLDGGATDSGRPYFVMELVKGVLITEYCDQNQVPIRGRLELFSHVCEALQHAHQKGIIHRDIKPSNVLVASHDGKPVVRVIDFGVAKAIGRQLTDTTVYTQFAQLIGTPLYMSPEQAGESSLDIDTRSDIYSLGVLLYELLTGTTPFDKERLHQVGYDEMRRIIREEEPPRPSTRISTLVGRVERTPLTPPAGDTSCTSSVLHTSYDVVTIASQRKSDPKRLSQLFRGELDWIVMKALEKDRNRRYETASAFVADVQRYLQDEPVLAYPPSASYRVRKFVRRNKGPVTAAAVVLLALSGGIVGTTWQAVRATRERNDKETALERVVEERGAKETALDDETAARERAMAALRTLTDDVVERQLARQPRLSDHDRAFLNKIVAHYEGFASLKGDRPECRAMRAEGDLRVGMLRHRLGQLAEARASYMRALQLLQQVVADAPTESDRNNLASSRLNLAMLLADQGEPREAEAEYRQALVLYGALAANSPMETVRRNLAACHQNLGIVLGRLAQDKGAEDEYRTALDLRKKLADDFPAVPEYRDHVAGSYNALGNLLARQEKYEEAAIVFRAALDLRKKLADDYPDVPEYRWGLANTYNSLGGMLTNARKLAEAKPELLQAIAFQRQLADDFPSFPDYAVGLGGSYCNFGNLLRESGKAAEALDWYQRAIQRLTPLLQREARLHYARLFLRNSHLARARALEKLKRFDEAIPDWDRVLDLDETPNRANLAIDRLVCLARARPLEAAAEAEHLVQGDQPLYQARKPGRVYHAARIFAVASEHVEGAGEREKYAGRAVVLLCQAHDLGFFVYKTQTDNRIRDTALDPLRQREDFKKLVVELNQITKMPEGKNQSQ
jgi:serine/threonine protein kinase/tetratricopeptide (TPR) repeat protein